MTEERRDQRLMLDMLRSPATLFFRDKHIAIIQPVDNDSYVFYAPGIHIASEWQRALNFDFANAYIVRCNNKEYFGVTKSASNLVGGTFNFGVSAYLDSHVGKGEFDVRKIYDRSMTYYLKKYPSLYDAFGEMAKKMAFLPMIKDQTDKNIWKALDSDIRNLRYIKNLSYKRKIKILERWPATIKAMDQTQELCDLLITFSGSNLSYIDDKFKNQKLCLRAVSDYPHALQYVLNKTEKMCLIAIKTDVMVLRYIKNPTIKILVAAVNRSAEAWNFIKKEKVRKEVRKAKKQKKYRS